MLRLISYLFFILILTNLTFAQAKHLNKINAHKIVISYSKIFEKKLDTNNKTRENRESFEKFNKLIEESSKGLSYILTINNDKSTFKQNRIMLSDYKNEVMNKMAGSIGGTKGIFYVDKKDSIFINKKELRDKSYNVKVDLVDWNLTEDTKTINNYKCFKAIGTETTISGLGNQKKTIVAWFTPELPSFYGPASYFGLPGTILEVSNGKIKLRAEKIRFDKTTKEKIEIPVFEKVITESDYQELAKKMAPARLRKKLGIN